MGDDHVPFAAIGIDYQRLRRHENFWWFGIACLVLLGVSEILAKICADRKDELLSAREGVIAEERQQAAQQHYPGEIA
jgi:hypothetical protein